MDLSKLDNIKINFIIGHGRSGTTLLVVLLNQYENCIATPEIHHFIYFYKKYKNITNVSQELIDDYKKYITLFFNYKKNPLIGPPNNTLLDSLEIGQKINYGQLTKLIYLGLFGEKGIQNPINVIIDKNPYYTLQIDKIIAVFPDAKLLVLIRDYRAYILSNIQSQKPSVSKKTVEYHAYVWNFFLKNIIQGKKRYSDNLKIVKYEDIALDKENTIKDIVTFFGLDYNESIFDFHLTVKQKLQEINLTEKNYERMLKKIKDLSSPINSERVYAWKNSLKESDIEKADFISGSLGEKFNYNKLTTIPFFKKLSIVFFSFSSFMRVKLFEIIKSPELHFYYRYKINNKIK